VPTLQLTDDQVVELFRQLSPNQKQAVLVALATDSAADREARLRTTEDALRRVAAQRERNWDQMTEDERLDFVDDLVHEDRQCGA